MPTKNLILSLIVVGALLVLVSALAEPIGLGRGNGFGSRQLAGIIIGASLLLVGLLKRAKTANA